MKRVLFIDGLGFVSRLEEDHVEFSETFDGACKFDYQCAARWSIENIGMVGSVTCARGIWVFVFYSKNELHGSGILYVEGKGFMSMDNGWLLHEFIPARAKVFSYGDFERACREMGRRPGIDAWIVKISI